MDPPQTKGKVPMPDDRKQNECILCDRGSDLTPLLAFEYRGLTFRICPQHLPVLIHEPAKLAGKLPGAGEPQQAKLDG